MDGETIDAALARDIDGSGHCTYGGVVTEQSGKIGGMGYGNVRFLEYAEKRIIWGGAMRYNIYILCRSESLGEGKRRRNCCFNTGNRQ